MSSCTVVFECEVRDIYITLSKCFISIILTFSCLNYVTQRISTGTKTLEDLLQAEFQTSCDYGSSRCSCTSLTPNSIPCSGIVYTEIDRTVDSNCGRLEFTTVHKCELLESLSLPELLKPSRLDSVRATVTGPIPSSLSSLSHLRTLNLADNEFYGSIPTQLGHLENLRTLNLSYNQLTQTIPISFSNLVNLEVLALNNNNIAGPFPTNFELRNLSLLALDTNRMTGGMFFLVFVSFRISQLKNVTLQQKKKVFLDPFV